MIVAFALLMTTLTVQSVANPEVLELSVMNEVEHALDRAPKGVAFVKHDFGKGTASERAIRLLASQRADGRWLDGTNDVTYAAVRELKRAAYGDGAFKVLMIGNSFSICVLREMPQIAASLGIELDLASLYIGGCSLERHWQNCEVAATNSAYRPYQYDRNVRGKAVVKSGKINIPEALRSDCWDVVTIQQASHFSWQPATYHPFGDQLVAKIRELAPQAEIIVQETWSYLPVDKRFAKWGFGPREMYERLHDAYAAFAGSYGFRVIPVGTVIERWRQTQRPDPVGHRCGGKDVFHLNEAGEFLQGLVWTARFFGVDVTRSTYVPKGMSAETAAQYRSIVHSAQDSN